MANGSKELHTSPIKIDDEINEFSERPVSNRALYEALQKATENAGFTVIDPMNMESRVETVGEMEFDSSTSSLGLCVDGAHTELYSGSYFFVDDVTMKLYGIYDTGGVYLCTAYFYITTDRYGVSGNDIVALAAGTPVLAMGLESSATYYLIPKSAQLECRGYHGDE